MFCWWWMDSIHMWWSDPGVAPQTWCICNTWVSRKAVWSQQAHVGLAKEDVRPLKYHLFGAMLHCPRFAIFCSLQLAKRLHNPTVCIALAITACDGGFFHQLDLRFHLSYFTRATIFKVAIFELLSFAFTCPPPPTSALSLGFSVPFPDPHVSLFHHQTIRDIFLLVCGSDPPYIFL